LCANIVVANEVVIAVHLMAVGPLGDFARKSASRDFLAGGHEVLK